MEGSFYMLVPYFVFTSRTLQNSHVEALCFWKDLCPWKNQKREKVLGKKKEQKKTGPKKNESEPFCREKKIPMWKRLVLAELHAGVQILNKEVAFKPNFTTHNVKNEVSFPWCKYQPWYKNIYNRLE